MPKLVQVAGGPSVSFPDDATEEQISQVMARDFPVKQPDIFANSQPTVITSDDNLARAARDFQGLQSVGMNLAIRPSAGPAVVLGRALQKAGQTVYGATADAGQAVFGEVAANLYPTPSNNDLPDKGEPPANLAAVSRGEPLPAETQLKVLPGPLRVPAEAARGLIESTPQLAAVGGLELAGVPAPVGAALIFGSTPEGFSPKQAAIAAALPFVGRYGGEISGALARKMGVSGTQAQNIIKGLGGATAAASYLATIDASEIANLPADQRKSAMVDAVANAFSQLALGPMGVKYAEAPAGELAGRMLAENVAQTQTDVPQRTEGERQAIEAEAARGPDNAIVEPGQRPPAPGVDVEDLAAVPPKPPVRPRAEIARAPGNLFRPEVPETPPEERITAVEEIRRANARTTRQIQELFPKAQLTREQARSWRTAAWGSSEDVARTTQTPAVSEPQVDAEPGDTEIEANAAPAGAEPTAPQAPQPKGVKRFEEQYSPQQQNQFSTQVGLELTKPADLDQLLTIRKQSNQIAERWMKRAEKAKEEGNAEQFGEAMRAYGEAGHRAQLAREAIEVATNSGSWAEHLMKVGKRPLDWQGNAQVAAWLKANGKEADIVLPDELKPKEPAAKVGSQWTASTPVEGAKVKGHYDIVDATNLFTSQDPGFDPTLQPRDRTRVASQQQVANLVRGFEPQRLGSSPTTDMGSPIIDEAGQVLSGNGRTMALRQKYLTGKGDDYKDWLIQNAADYGLDPVAIAEMDKPVLVRRVTDYGKLSKSEFARQSNQQQVSGMSEAEKASADARMLINSPQLVELFRPNEEGNVLAASNREFLNAFVKGTGDQNELLSKEGYNAAALTKRVRNAVLGAFIGPENRTLLNQLLEEADTLNVKNAVNGLLQSAPQLMRYKGTPYDLSGLAAQALKDLVQLRTSGEKLDDFLASKELFADPARTMESDLLLAFLHQAKSAKALTEGLARYAAGAKEALQDLQSGGMLGATPATRGELIERANQQRPGQGQTNLEARESQLPFGEPGQANAPGVSPSQDPGSPGVSEFREPEAAYGLAAPQRAIQDADTGLRGSTQQRNAPLQQAAGQLNTQAPPGTAPGPRWFSGLRKIFAAGTVDQDAEVMAGIARHALGKEYESGRQADFALRTFRQEFDRTPVARSWKFQPGIPLPRNYEVMRAIDTGDFRALTPAEAQFAGVMRRLFDQAIEMVHQVSPESLRNLIENYFPRIWEDPVRNQAKITQLMSRRPWEGPKSFMRKRVLEYFTDGLALGLRPVSDNPVDVTLHKLGEMYRFVATRQAMEEAKSRGLRRFVYIYEKPPGDHWRQVDDPSSTIYAPPVVTVREAFDAQVRAKTLELLDALSVPHERKVQIGGATRWGYADPNTGKIVTKFGGPDSVIWHEFGHQMDFRYPDLRSRFPMQGNSTMAQELRALADLRFEGQSVSPSYRGYVRDAAEKMANLFDAYIRAPKRFQSTAPNVWSEFNSWLSEHPEVKRPLNEVAGTFDAGSLTLGTAEAEQFLGGPVLLGRWMMPEGAAQVVDNYLKPGLGRYKWFRSLREISGLVNGIQLAGFFHGGFVLNDSFYSGIGLAIYDTLQGKFGRAAREVLEIPISPFTSLYRGGKIKQAIENPAAANAAYRQLADLAVEQNLRAGHGNFDPQFTRRWSRSMHELLHEPSLGAAWETLWRTPMASVNLAMKPVMEFFVPRMKLGIMARMAERVITDNPGADTLTLRRLLAKAADATEDRLGQVTYDNLFQHRVLKDSAQLAMRAYGWQLTKYRMIGGGLGDWMKAGRDLAAGKPPEVTFRMTYLPAMVIGHAMLGATLHYALTRKRPQKLVDYLFPESGLVDAFGQPVRLSIADFVKDVVADFRSFPHVGKMAGEFTRKLAPFWNMAAEMYRNQDFWGTEIFSRHKIGQPELDHVMENIWEGIQYMGKNTLPFSVRGSTRLHEAGASRLGTLGPMVGLTPAPRYATQTPAESRAQEIMRDNLPKAPTTKDQAARSQAEAQIVRDIRTGKLNREGEFEARAKAAGIDPHNQRELTKLRERVFWTPLQYQVHKMSVPQSMEVFDLASDAERVSLAPFLADKINQAWSHGRISPADARRFVQLVMPYYQRRQPAAGRPAAAPAAKPYSAFSPQR